MQASSSASVFRLSLMLLASVLAPSATQHLDTRDRIERQRVEVDGGGAAPDLGLGVHHRGGVAAVAVHKLSAVLAVSFGRIFYRNALNFGLRALWFPAAADISAGETLDIDAVQGRIVSPGTGRHWQVAGIPPHLMAMVAAGGLMPWLKQRLAAP